MCSFQYKQYLKMTHGLLLKTRARKSMSGLHWAHRVLFYSSSQPVRREDTNSLVYFHCPPAHQRKHTHGNAHSRPCCTIAHIHPVICHLEVGFNRFRSTVKMFCFSMTNISFCRLILVYYQLQNTGAVSEETIPVRNTPE